MFALKQMSEVAVQVFSFLNHTHHLVRLQLIKLLALKHLVIIVHFLCVPVDRSSNCSGTSPDEVHVVQLLFQAWRSRALVYHFLNVTYVNVFNSVWRVSREKPIDYVNLRWKVT